MLVMPDIEDPFVPLGGEGLFVDAYESRSVDISILVEMYLLCRSIITSLLTQIPKLFSDIKNPEPTLLPTLNAALAALSATGGKVICSMRDDNKLHGIETEKKLFQTEHPGWKKTASKMVESGVGVDFFIAAPGGVYMDIATIGNLNRRLPVVIQS